MDDKFEMLVVHYESIVHETDKAYLFDLYGKGGEGIWIPKSQIKELDENLRTFEIPQWLAEEKELE